MKNIFTILLFTAVTFSFNNCGAQNYSPFNAHSGSNYHYNYDGGLFGVAFDSVKVSGKDSIAYLYKAIEDTSLYGASPLNCIFKSNGKCWLGSKMIMRGNGYFIFDNRFNDSICINAKADTGNSWAFYKYNSDSIIRATVIDIKRMQYSSFSDSVKMILLNVIDTLGHPFSSIWNGRTIWLSKNHGLLRTPAFYAFPYDTSFLYHFYFPTYLTRGWLSNHEIGDEIDFNHTGQYASNNPNIYATATKYIDKVYPGQDSAYATYSILHYYIKYGTSYNNPGYDTSYITRETDVILHDTTPLFSNAIACTTQVTMQAAVSFDSCTQTLYSGPGQEFEPCDSSGYLSYPFEFCGFSSQDYWGIITLHSFSCAQGWSDNFSEYLGYYKKGNLECGSSLLAGVNNVQDNSSLKVYPNPAGDMVNVDIDGINNHAKQIKVISVYGAVVETTDVSDGQLNHFIVNLKTLPAGMYILQVDFSDKTVYKKIIKTGSGN